MPFSSPRVPFSFPAWGVFYVSDRQQGVTTFARPVRRLPREREVLCATYCCVEQFLSNLCSSHGNHDRNQWQSSREYAVTVFVTVFGGGAGVDWRSEERLLHGGLCFSRRVGGISWKGMQGNLKLWMILYMINILI